MVLFEKKWSDLANLRIVSGAHPSDDPMRAARSIEQCFMSKVLHDVDAKAGGAHSHRHFAGWGAALQGASRE
jgi:hypothetical protein